MDLEDAKRIVALLANGTDPSTGEVLPEDSPYNSPVVIRALFTLLINVQTGKKAGTPSVNEPQEICTTGGKPRNSGLPWSEDLKKQLSEKFLAGHSIFDLAKEFERTEGAIRSELLHQGLIKKKAY